MNYLEEDTNRRFWKGYKWYALFLFVFMLTAALCGATNVLTPHGYVDAATLNIGDTVVGENSLNTINTIARWDSTTDTANQGAFTFFLINGKYNLYKNQSIVDNSNVRHAFEVQVGDTIYSDKDSLIIVNSVDSSKAQYWYRFTISGDHTYKADGLLLHNASRYWVGGGASANWNATSNTNWGSTSGGSNNASVPGSADDVHFDGAGTNGNTNSTISATITILSFTNTTGYTHTITTNATLTIAGNITLASGILWAGANAWSVSAACTFTSNGVTFVPPLIVSGTTTVTLSGNLACSGLLTFNGSAVVNLTTSETLTLSGGLLINSGSPSGTATIILTGGTWSEGGSGGQLKNNLTLSGNVTLSGTVLYNTGTLTYSSGTITTIGSTLSCGASTTFNTGSGVTFNNVSLTGNSTFTLNADIYCNGLLTLSGGSATTTINGNTIHASGGLTQGISSNILGTTLLNITGGTITGSSPASSTTVSLQLNITIAGSCTWSGMLTVSNNTLTFSSGTQTFNSGAGVTVYSAGNNYTITNNINGLTGMNLTCLAAGTFTLTINGSYGISIPTWTIYERVSNGVMTCTLTYGNTYNITTAFYSTLTGTNLTETNRCLINSSSAGNKISLTLSASATQNIERLNFTDIDASAGQTIFTYSPYNTANTLTNTKNIKLTPTGPITVGQSLN